MAPGALAARAVLASIFSHASVRTDRRIASISSNCSVSAISGGDELDDRVAAVVGAADQPPLEELAGEEAAQQPLGLLVVEALLASPCP